MRDQRRMTHRTIGSSMAAAMLSAIALAFAPGPGGAATAGQDNQTPDTLCKCSGDDAATRGGIRSWQEFEAKYGLRFRTPAEGLTAWRVYQASNRCNALMVIGRLNDTVTFVGKPGCCVLRTLKPWTLLINDAFIQGGIDRRARFRFVSGPYYEAAGNDPEIDVELVERDPESNWNVVYNHEIAQILKSGVYGIVGSVEQASPTSPAYLAVKVDGPPCWDFTGRWEGKLVVREVKGPSNIEPGQSRKAVIDAVQGGCSLVVRFSDQEVGGVLSPSPLPNGTLSDNPTGTLISADVVGSDPPGRMRLTLAQKLPNGGSVVSAGELTRK